MRQITVSMVVSGDIDLNDISDLRENIIRNLDEDGGEITVSVTISASKPEGFSENAVRAVRENADALDLDFNGV